MTVLRSFLQTTLVLLFALVLCELLSAAFFTLRKEAFTFQGDQSFLLDQDRIPYLMDRFDAQTGWLPNYQTKFRQRRSVKSYGENLVWTFGDSYTHGDEVQDDQTWQYYLEALIQKGVVNLGMGGYGTDQALLRYKSLPTENSAQIVTLGMILENINRTVNRYRPFYFPRTGIPLTKPRFTLESGRLRLLPNPIQHKEDLLKLTDLTFVNEIGREDWWYQNSYYPRLGFPYTRLLLHSSIWRQVTAPLFGLHRSDLDARPEVNLWQNHDIKMLYFAILEEFQEVAQSRSQIPVFVLFPTYHEVLACFDHKLPGGAEELRDFFDQNSYHFFDGLEYFCRTLKGQDLTRYYQRGGHFSPLGNEHMAIGFSPLLITDLRR